MKTYKIVFTCQSVVNEIPNSQTIFGAICNILLQTKGKDALDEYISSLNTKAKMVHSSMFLNHTLPMIKKNVFSLEYINTLLGSVKAEDKLKVLESAKRYKQISSMSEMVYKNYVENNRIETLTIDLQEKSNDFEIKNGLLKYSNEKLNTEMDSILLTRNGFPEKENDKTLFYSNAIYYPKGTEFCIYVKTEENVDYLKSIFNYFEYFGVGSRRTVGDNSFRLERIEEWNQSSDMESKLVLSHYIPNDEEVDYSNSFYKLTSNVYRTSKNYAGGYVSGRFMHLMEGSFMRFLENKEYYGKVLETSVNGKTVYHYAIGFVL